jgi:hypothetical protein
LLFKPNLILMKKLFLFLAVPVALVLYSCGGEKWTQEDKDKFVKECVAQAEPGMEKEQKLMCDCMLSKVVAKFPSYAKAEATMTDAEIETVASECADQVLPKEPADSAEVDSAEVN